MSLVFVVGCTLGLVGLVHITWWRLEPPRRQRDALMCLFLAGGAFGVLVFSWISPTLGFRHLSWVECLQAWMAVASAGTAYVVTYSAVEFDSPTLSLMRYIASKGTAGCHRDELIQFMRQRPFVLPRLEAMLGEGMILESEGRIMLGSRRQTLLRWVLWYWNRVLGMEGGGG